MHDPDEVCVQVWRAATCADEMTSPDAATAAGVVNVALASTAVATSMSFFTDVSFRSQRTAECRAQARGHFDTRLLRRDRELGRRRRSTENCARSPLIDGPTQPSVVTSSYLSCPRITITARQ